MLCRDPRDRPRLDPQCVDHRAGQPRGQPGAGRQLVGGLAVPVRETSSTLGRPDVKIVDTAKEVRASLIVMGAYGRTRITDYFLGSNAASVARTSPVAVLLAR